MPPWCRSTEVGQSRQASDSGHRLFVFSGPWSPAFATGRDGHRGKTLAVPTCATVRCRGAIVSRSPFRIRRRLADQAVATQGNPNKSPCEAGVSECHAQQRPQASRIADCKIVARLFPRSQRHGRAVAILTQSRRRAHDACIHHCGRDCFGAAGHMGGPGAACGLRACPTRQSALIRWRSGSSMAGQPG
jgi:hypothetical protein